MRKIIIFLSVLLVTTNLFSQKKLKTTEDIAVYLCQRLDSIDLELPPSIIEQKCLSIFNEFKFTPEYSELILKLNTDYLDKYPYAELYEAGAALTCDLTYNLMKNCKTFQSIALFNGEDVPLISPETKKVGDHFTKLLKIRTQNDEISQELVDECIEIVMEINEDYINDKFPDEKFIRYLKEFQAYTMTCCDLYMKWMIGQEKWNYFDLTIR